MSKNNSLRLEKILISDKSGSLNKILPALKADLRDVIRLYGEILGDVEVEITESDDGFFLSLFCSLTRIATC